MTRRRAGAIGLILLLAMLPKGTLAGGETPDGQLDIPYGQMSGFDTLISVQNMLSAGQLTLAGEEKKGSFGLPAVAAPADAEGTVPLYEMPDESGAVLMEYYSGSALTVLRDASETFYRVQAGEPGAGVTGYMRKEDVKVGQTAPREAQLRYMELQLDRDVEVYAYCDTLSEQIWTARAGQTLYAMSRSDGGWVQLCLPPVAHVWEAEDRPASGFVHLEPGIARGYFRETTTREVEPCAGEPETEQMTEIAIAYLTSRTEGISGTFAEREALEAMDKRVQMLWRYGSSVLEWQVNFWQEVGGEVVSVRIRLL
ncbi:MAG: SH3 domain-containing protein, partial [Clostridia bacterium]|nr:SH3 domain-containing protein [Clostridia bacterium]